MSLKLSVIVVTYNLRHQIHNTLHSLLPSYQKNLKEEDYEILLVDNGSQAPLDENIRGLSSNIRYRYLSPEEASPSPVRVLNEAVRQARSQHLCIMIDGARMLTPGVLSWGLRLLACDPDGAAEVREWHLGPKKQYESILEGYNTATEKQLLRSISWKENGYRLFKVAVPTRPLNQIYFGKVRESTCLFMTRDLFDRTGGFDERYEQPGGGHANIDFFWRLAGKASHIYTILGEGTFHQLHGGAVTGKSYVQLAVMLPEWWKEYEKLSRPRDLEAPYRPAAIGHLPEECRPVLGFEVLKENRNPFYAAVSHLRELARI